jgi:DNA-binding NarL/FixJ family response regulator
VKLGVFVVEDSDLLRQRIVQRLAEIDGVEVVGEATTEADAIAGILQVMPQAVVLDLQLRVGSGFRVLEAIRRGACQASVIVQTSFATPEYAQKCRQYGADHFLDKSGEFERLVELVQAEAARPGRRPA